MKRWTLILALVCLALLSACGKQTAGAHTEPAADPVSGEVWLTEKENSGGERYYSIEAEIEPFRQENLGQGVYDALAEDWAVYAEMTEFQRGSSSTLPGSCDQYFEEWTDCEAFMGISIPNPLEACDWLEKGTYLATPLGSISPLTDDEIPHVRGAWRGSEDGHVSDMGMQAGYRCGDIRVQMLARCYDGSAETCCVGGVTSEAEAYPMKTGSDALIVPSGETHRYYSVDGLLARGSALYWIHVTGEPDEQEAVRDTLEQILDLFQ